MNPQEMLELAAKMANVTKLQDQLQDRWRSLTDAEIDAYNALREAAHDMINYINYIIGVRGMLPDAQKALLRTLSDTQKALLRTFSSTGMSTIKAMKVVTKHYHPALMSLLRQGLVIDAQKDCGKGQYALTHKGGAAMPDVMGEGWEKPW